MSGTLLIVIAMRNSQILELSFSVTLHSRLSSGDSLPWVARGVRYVYCELSWLGLEPAVRTCILDYVEASSELWVDQPGSGVTLIFFCGSELSSCHVGKPNLVWKLYFKILVLCYL